MLTRTGASCCRRRAWPWHIDHFRPIRFELVPARALVLADHIPWHAVFLITALFMLPGIANTLLVSEPLRSRNAPRTLTEAVVEPFHEFITRAGWHQALLILGFIFLYNLGASMATALATPFYLDMGFSKTEIGLIAKNVGLGASVAGGLLGGLWMLRIGINRALWLFGAVQVVSILGFAWLAHEHARPGVLAVVIGSSLGLGLATRHSSHISRATDPRYTATQFALFTSLAVVPDCDNATPMDRTDRLFDFFLLCVALECPVWLVCCASHPGMRRSPPGVAMSSLLRDRLRRERYVPCGRGRASNERERT